MSIKRDKDDLPGGVIVNVKNALGETVQVDHDEYEEMVDDDNITFPSGHNADAMTLADVFPGYDPT
jgi:hypothetical protein